MLGLIERASACNDLDTAARVIQDALGIETGDAAGMFFSGNSLQGWTFMDPKVRAAHLLAYLRYEISLAD